jgi:hypothetical protein
MTKFSAAYGFGTPSGKKTLLDLFECRLAGVVGRRLPVSLAVDSAGVYWTAVASGSYRVAWLRK